MEFTRQEKREIILGLIYKHFEIELAQSVEDKEIAELIIKVCEEKI